jgi:hypothetical protein
LSADLANTLYFTRPAWRVAIVSFNIQKFLDGNDISILENAVGMEIKFGFIRCIEGLNTIGKFSKLVVEWTDKRSKVFGLTRQRTFSRCVQMRGGRFRFMRRIGVADGPLRRQLKSRQPSTDSENTMSCFPEKNLYFCLTPSTSTSVWHSV